MEAAHSADRPGRRRPRDGRAHDPGAPPPTIRQELMLRSASAAQRLGPMRHAPLWAGYVGAGRELYCRRRCKSCIQGVGKVRSWPVCAGQRAVCVLMQMWKSCAAKADEEFPSLEVEQQSLITKITCVTRRPSRRLPRHRPPRRRRNRRVQYLVATTAATLRSLHCSCRPTRWVRAVHCLLFRSEHLMMHIRLCLTTHVLVTSIAIRWGA